MLEFQDQQHEERYKDKWYGKYRAFVRDNNDPERLGRCRLEVPAVLGVGKENWSDWAWPCFPYGGNDDIGMFLVPEEGASVWAEFEGGDPQYPIWTGVWLAMSNPGEQPEEVEAAVLLGDVPGLRGQGGACVGLRRTTLSIASITLTRLTTARVGRCWSRPRPATPS